MNATEADTTCPECQCRFPVPEEEGEARCPSCEWEFLCDAEGNVVDDGERDPEPPFAVDDEGEIDSEGLVLVRCPRCHRPQEIEAGERQVWCPRCQRLSRLPFVRSREGPPNDPEEWDGPEEEEEEEEEQIWDGEEADGPNCPSCDKPLHGTLVYGWLPPKGSRLTCRRCCHVIDWPWLMQKVYPEQWEAYSRALEGQRQIYLDERGLARIRVAADGSGDYATINEALRDVRRETMIVVAPGTYREALDFPDYRDEPLLLHAEGPAGSVCIESAPGCRFDGSRYPILIQGVTFAAPISAAPAVAVDDGLVFFVSCKFVGNEIACVWARGATTVAFLRSCRLTGTAPSGVLAESGAATTLVSCEIGGGLQTGATVLSGGRLVLQRCGIREPKSDGVCLGRYGLAELFNTVIAGAGRAAVRAEGARLHLEGCRLENGSSGVQLMEGFALLNRTSCHGQRNTAVQARTNAGFILRSCDLSPQGSYTVRLRDRARALFEDCTLTTGAKAGLVLGKDAKARLDRCEFRRNGGVVIRRARGADVRLEECRVTS